MDAGVSKLKDSLVRVCFKQALAELHNLVSLLVEDYTQGEQTLRGPTFFRNVVLAPDFFEVLGIGLHLESGTIQQFETDLSIVSLFTTARTSKATSRFAFKLSGVRLTVTPSAQFTKIPPLQKKKQQVDLVLASLFTNSFTNITGKTLSDVFRESNFILDDLIIHYLDPVNNFRAVLDARLILQEAGRSSEKNRFEFQGLRVRLFDMTSLQSPVDYGDEENSTETKNKDREDSILKRHDPSMTAEAMHAQGYLLSPISGEALVFFDYQPKDSTEEVTGETNHEISYGCNVAINISSSVVDLFLNKTTVKQVYSIINRVSTPLFEDAKGQYLSIELLRWFAARGHEKEYWKFCLSKAMPRAILQIARRQHIRMNERWAQVYGLLSPPTHREEYVSLYQRSLNLAGTQPLDYQEEAEKKVCVVLLSVAEEATEIGNVLHFLASAIRSSTCRGYHLALENGSNLQAKSVPSGHRSESRTDGTQYQCRHAHCSFLYASDFR